MSNQKRNNNKLGGFMCKILRHAPKQFGVTIDEYGYCDIDEFLNAINKDEFWKGVTKEDLLEIVKTDNKQRYEIDGNKIKARYGHSVPIIQEKGDKKTPDFLFHGTNEQAMEFIWDKKEGLKSMGRQFVHLSETENFANLAAKRRRNPLLIKVNVKKAQELGVEFYYAGNEVWLSKSIPFEALEK